MYPKIRRISRLVALVGLLVPTASLQLAVAATAPSLGTASSFAVLGGSTVTNTGPTIISGNLGLSPGTAVTGFPPGIVVAPGTIHAADAVAALAQNDKTTAFNALAGQACNFNLTGQDLGGLTLIPGVYCFASSAQLTGTLTLDAQGNASAVWIFQIGSSLVTASNSAVNIINGGSACNLFWQIGSSATLGTTTSFQGNILAATSITLNTGANLSGRALATTGAVTLDSNIVSLTDCNASFIAPPTITKSFGAATIGVGGTTTLTFTINNPNAGSLTGVAFTDAFLGGLIVTTPLNGLTGTCGGGTITAVPGSGTVSLGGATLAGGTSCTFSINVTGTMVGTINNSVTVGSTNGGNGNTSTTSLNVAGVAPIISPPTIAKTFGAASIGVGGTTTLTFTINNPNGVPLSNVAFTDTFPVGFGLIVSTPSNALTGTCGGGTITALPGSGSVSLTGATLPANSSCTFTVNVTGTIPGIITNSVTATSLNGGAGNTSSALLTVIVSVVSPPTISKSFGPILSIPVGGSVVLSFTINNPNPTEPVTSVGFLDVLPAGLLVASPNGLTGVCGGGTITAPAGSVSISLAGANLAPGTSCTFSVNVIATTAGLLTNITANVTSANGGTGNTSLANILVGENFQILYAANLQIADSVINITNTGTNGAALNGPGFGGAVGNVCANVYAFSPDEQLVSCCSCLITPNGLASLSLNNDVLSNTLTGVRPNSVIVKMVNTGAGAAFNSTSCTNSAAAAGSTNFPLASGLLAFGTTIHAAPVVGAFAVTETQALRGSLSAAELASITNRCTNILGNGSSFGICRSCRIGGLGKL